MNRKEAIEKLKNIRNVPSVLIDGIIKDLVEALEKPLTLADLLAWEEGVEYEWRNEKYKICDDILQCYDKNDDCWYDSVEEINDYLRLQQAKKVEPKLKAYHVKDEYSYECLVQELEEQGYAWSSNQKPTEGFNWDVYNDNTVIYCDENNWLSFSDLCYFNGYKKSSYDLIEYHKEEPKYYAKIKGWELITHDYGDCYWHKDKNPIHGLYPWSREEASIYTKTEWNKLGINDTNADFERVVQ